MDRTLQVHVDRTTWPTPPDPPAFRAAFAAGTTEFQLNIPGVLLTIGCLTTRSHASGVSLSEFWAWVRCLHAIADVRDLGLTPAYSELDAHRKTIFSENFGIRAPVYWLPDCLTACGSARSLPAATSSTVLRLPLARLRPSRPNEERENRPTSSSALSMASGTFSHAHIGIATGNR